MANSSLPSFDGTEYSVRSRRTDTRPKRKIPIFVLAIIGFYIGFLAYYLVVEEALGLAPEVAETVETVDPQVPVINTSAPEAL